MHQAIGHRPTVCRGSMVKDPNPAVEEPPKDKDPSRRCLKGSAARVPCLEYPKMSQGQTKFLEWMSTVLYGKGGLRYGKS